MFGIEVKDGKASEARVGPGVNDHEVSTAKHPPELIEQALWVVAVQGGVVTKACEALREAGIVGKDGKPIARRTLSHWKKVSHRNRYAEILRTKVNDLDQVIVEQAQANAIKLGDAQDRALDVTMAGLAGANAVEASTVMRNIAQSRQIEITKAMELRGIDPESRKGRSLELVAAELAALGPNIVRIEREDPDTGVLDPGFEHDLPELVEAEVVDP